MRRRGPTPGARRSRGTLVAACLMLFVVQVDFFALNLALPDMAVDLGVSVPDLQWVLSAYMIAVAASFIAAGRAGDVLGRRRVLLVASALFGLGSLVGGLAPDETVLVAARIVQGVGAAGMVTTGIAVVTNAFPADRVAAAIGIVFTAGGVGSAVGPLVGGVLTTFVSWRWVLLVNVPLILVLVALVAVAVADSRDETAPRSIDVPGLVLVAVGLATVTFGIDSAQQAGWGDPQTIAPIAVGAALLVAFVLVERRVRFPLVDLGLLRNHPFVVVMVAGGVAQLPWVGTIFLSAIYLQDVRDLSAAGAGLAFLPLSVGAAISGYMSGRLGRFLPQQIMMAAMVVGGASVIALGLVDGWVPYLLALLTTGLGAGLAFAYVSVGTQTVVPPRRAGQVSGLVFTFVVACSALIVAVISTILARGTGGAVATSPELADVVRDLLVVVGVVSIAAGVATLLAGRVTREEIAALQGEA